MNNPLATLTDQFLKERTYLKNVTPATLLWYREVHYEYMGTGAISHTDQTIKRWHRVAWR